MKKSKTLEEKSRHIWTQMTLTRIGRIQEVVRGGGGKISIPQEDSGDDPRKPKGLG